MPLVPRPAVSLVAALVMALAFTGCTSNERPTAEPSARPTPLSGFDSSVVTVARADFCDRIPDSAVQAAVGEVKDTSHYGNGEAATIVPGVKDVTHEFNCASTGASGSVARVWVFAPPPFGEDPAPWMAAIRSPLRMAEMPLMPRPEATDLSSGSFKLARWEPFSVTDFLPQMNRKATR